MLKFSVIMSIYKSDQPELVRVALDSLLQQTLLPNEIVIVADGPVPAELEQVVSSFKFQVSKIRTTPNPSLKPTPSPSLKGRGQRLPSTTSAGAKSSIVNP